MPASNAAHPAKPGNGQPLQLVGEGGRQRWSPPRGAVSDSQPDADMRRPSDMTGDNGKYNHLYEDHRRLLRRYTAGCDVRAVPWMATRTSRVT